MRSTSVISGSECYASCAIRSMSVDALEEEERDAGKEVRACGEWVK
jgi:hypothetical protein